MYEELGNTLQAGEEKKMEERIANQQNKYKELKVAVDKIIKTFDKDTDVSIHISIRMFTYVRTYSYDIYVITCAMCFSYVAS